MKQWEVIKELTDDPTKVFKGKDGWFIKFAEEGNLTWFNDKFVGYAVFTVKQDELDEDWQLVRQPVTWQEAIQAWSEGSDIKECFPRSERLYRSGDTIHLNENDVLNGTWYVED